MGRHPFLRHLIAPMELALPSGKSVPLPRCEYRFPLWQGDPIPDTYGGKSVLDFGGTPLFAELAILGVLRQDGWDGVWVDTFRREFRRSMPNDCCDLPPLAQAVYKPIFEANGGKSSSFFDVFAWKGTDYLFIESKRKSEDVIQWTQKAWIEAALNAGVLLDSLLVCEWGLDISGYDPDLFQSKEDVEELRRLVEEADRRLRPPMTSSATKGSQKWLRVAVNEKPEVLLAAIQRSGAIPSGASIAWSSPLERDGYCEYRDSVALKKASIAPASLEKPLAEFWPARGPVWDAIGVTPQSHSIFVEAKAHIPEAASPATKATLRSRKLIRRSLHEARKFYAPEASADWSRVFYQYANRLAHHYFLTELNGLSSSLVFLYFVNAFDMRGPLSEDEWHGAVRLIHTVLGLPEDLTRHGVFDAFLDVRLLEEAVDSP